jgi:hypothetical protein
MDRLIGDIVGRAVTGLVIDGVALVGAAALSLSGALDHRGSGNNNQSSSYVVRKNSGFEFEEVDEKETIPVVLNRQNSSKFKTKKKMKKEKMKATVKNKERQKSKKDLLVKEPSFSNVVRGKKSVVDEKENDDFEIEWFKEEQEKHHVKGKGNVKVKSKINEDEDDDFNIH